QRERYPESYRLARRISDLLQAQPEFRRFEQAGYSTSGEQRRSCNKMALKVYGLTSWPSDMEVKASSSLPELIKDVAFRQRDTRRTGRGSGSQVIISNKELKRLMIDIFFAIDSPADIRTTRSLVLSKLAVEDCRLVSIDAPTTSSDAEQPPLRVDLPD